MRQSNLAPLGVDVGVADDIEQDMGRQRVLDYFS
jgi:hypothetical protein